MIGALEGAFVLARAHAQHRAAAIAGELIAAARRVEPAALTG